MHTYIMGKHPLLISIPQPEGEGETTANFASFLCLAFIVLYVQFLVDTSASEDTKSLPVENERKKNKIIGGPVHLVSLVLFDFYFFER